MSRQRVVVLAGPSGSGKTRLARRLHIRHGWPVVRLDDFYRSLPEDGADPALPTRDLGGTTIVDWDDPRSWDGDAAVDALSRLVETGQAQIPDYDIATSRAVGTSSVCVSADDLVLAEGIFAAEVIGALGEAGLLHSAWCVRHNRWVTFARRLARDLAQRRKPPLVLVRRGLALCRAEPEVVARIQELGAVCAAPARVERRLASAAAARVRAPG